MKCEFESWSIGNGDIAVYTTEPETAKTLKEMIGTPTTYERAGRVFAWQFVLPKSRRGFIERKLSRKFHVDSKAVTGARNGEFDIADLRQGGVEETYGEGDGGDP